MTHIGIAPRRKVLVSGAGIAGPTLAFWLNRYGYDVTVVETASTIRTGGYPIDVRGTALEVVRRMGLLPRLREAQVDVRRMTFLDEDGGEVVSLHPHQVTGSVTGRDLEVPRGVLTEALHDAVRDDVEFVFDDAIETLEQSGDGVDVTFRRGGGRRFDLVIGAEGLHSRTREMVFGPEERFLRYLGYCFAVFLMPNTFGISRETVMWNAPGRAAALYATGDDEVHAFFTFARPQSPFDAFPDPEAQRKLVAEVFTDAGWEVPRMLAAMRDVDDVFFDAVAQIRMPRWSSGRVALVGDAAHAPSFLTGQGTSLTLVTAYMLAHSLAGGADHVAAFAAYERDTREFVTLNQDLVGAGAAALFPTTAKALRQRNDRLRGLTTMPADTGRPAHSALTLPEPRPAAPGYAR